MKGIKTDSINSYGLSGYNIDQIKVFARILEMEEMNTNIVYARRPDAALNPIKYIKNMSPEIAKLIVPDAFAGKTGIELLKNMNVKQIEKIGAGNDLFLKLAIKNTFNRLLELEGEKNNHQTEKIRQYLAYSPAWQF